MSFAELHASAIRHKISAGKDKRGISKVLARFRNGELLSSSR
jgi:hypothetical protein